MLGSTMVRVVGQQYCVRFHGPLDNYFITVVALSTSIFFSLCFVNFVVIFPSQ